MKFVSVSLTEGNLRHNHLYLSSVIDFFPADAIGGANVESEARQKLEVHSGIGQPVLTDIAGDKKIFRKRNWVREFFKAHELEVGSSVIIQKIGPTTYHVFPSCTPNK